MAAHPGQNKQPPWEVATMDRRTGTVNWINAYLEWSGADGWAFGPAPLACSGFGATGANSSEAIAAAYLDWIDEAQQLCVSNRPYHAAAPASLHGGIDDSTIDGESRGLDVFRETLMVVLHTESDCIQFLHRILDAGDATPGTVTLTLVALEHAERLLENERRAWRSLTLLGRRELPKSSTTWRTDFEKNWPRVLEDVNADVQGLTRTVLALISNPVGNSPVCGCPAEIPGATASA